MFQSILSLFKREKTVLERCDEAREVGLQAFEKGFEQDDNPIHVVDDMTDLEWKYWDDGWQTGKFQKEKIEHLEETEDLLKKLQEAVKNWNPKERLNGD